MDANEDERCKHGFFDFGTVMTGSRSFKTVRVKNDGTVNQQYDISRDPDTNPLDYAFQIEPYTSGTIKPGCSFAFRLEYTPSVPFTINFDYFNVSDLYGVCFKFGVKGKTSGPAVRANAKKMIFVAIGLKTVMQKTMVITNESSIKATFQFDIDPNHYVFHVAPMHGVIQPFKSMTVVVTFCSSSTGIFSNTLFCLVHYQRPLMVDLVGVRTLDETFTMSKVALTLYPHQETVATGYERYMSDGMRMLEFPPPVQLSANNLDFGYTDPSTDRNLAQVVCVTNSTSIDVTVDWELDPSEVFCVQPVFIKIPRRASALFEVYFRPHEADQLYSKQLTARVYWDERRTVDSLTMGDEVKDVAVPLTLFLRLMGHTLSFSTQPLQPQFDLIPPTIKMPPCVPPSSVYTTFIIRRLGDRPLMFKFVQPPISHYVLKPKQGVIREKSQIIVVGLCPESKEETPYFERWAIQFNGSPDHEVTIDLMAYAEFPTVRVGLDNTVYFPPTFPGTEQNGEVFIKNFTRHYIRYNFLVTKPDSCLHLVEHGGTIAANEIVYNTWQYAPKQDGIDMVEVKCETCALEDCCYPVGTLVETLVMVYGESEFSELVAFPPEHQCGTLMCGDTNNFIFHLFNFGRCVVYFDVLCQPHEEMSDFEAGDVTISLSQNQLEPSGRVEVRVHVKPTHVGIYLCDVAYVIRVSANSTQLIAMEPKPVFAFRYDAILSDIQVADLNYLGAAPIMSKLWIWRMMNINRLNEALRALRPQARDAVQIFVPHAPLNSAPLHVFLLLRNQSGVPATWALTRRDTCRCTVREETMSMRLVRHDCAHRHQVVVHPASGNMKDHEEMVLMITFQYTVEGMNEVLYSMDIDNSRRLILSFIVMSLSPKAPTPSACTNALLLRDAFIGDSVPALQAYWLYNSFSRPALYAVDTKELSAYSSGQEPAGQNLQCLNPRGHIPPGAAHPLLFRFRPNALIAYEVSAPICLGDEWFDLNIRGSGAVAYQKSLQFMLHKAPQVPLFDLNEMPVYLSADHILIESIPTHSRQERIVFIENRTSDVCMEFSWQTYHLAECLTCWVEPAKGSLDAYEAALCKVIVESHSMPCLLTVQVICELINLNAMNKHYKSKERREEFLKNTEGEFVVTESGTFAPHYNIPIFPSPESIFRTLSVSCNVISLIDMDEKLPLRDQRKLYPSPEAVVKSESDENFKAPVEYVSIAREVLDLILWDTVFGPRFENALQKLKVEESPYYLQFVMGQEEEDRLVRALDKLPQHALVALILRDLIFEIFEEEYSNGFSDIFTGVIYLPQNTVPLTDTWGKNLT